MFVPPSGTSLSMTIPLVPPRALGAVTQLDVGAPAVQVVGVVNEVVIVELFTYPTVASPTPKNIMSVPLSNSVRGEHSSPFVVSTSKVDVAVLAMRPLVKGNIYISGGAGISGLVFVPDMNPHAIMCPVADPFSQNALSNVPECTLFPVHVPLPSADPRFTNAGVVSDVKFAGIWMTAPPKAFVLLHPVNANTWSIVGLAGSLTAIGGSTIPVPAPPASAPTVCRAANELPGLVRLTEYRNPDPSPRKIRPEWSSTTGAVNTVLLSIGDETVTGQLSGSLTSAGAPPPNTGVILYSKPLSAPTYAVSEL